MLIRRRRWTLLLVSAAVSLLCGGPVGATDCWDCGEPGFQAPVTLSGAYLVRAATEHGVLTRKAVLIR
jgi:hypothetical protein